VTSHSIRSISAALTAAFLLAAPAAGADLGGNCCADLEERIAELEATTVRKGNRKVSLTISGTVNEAIMFWDDSVESDAYIVTNETKRTRLNFAGQAKINADVSAGFVMEIGPRGARQDRADQNNNAVIATPDVRFSYIYAKSKTLGQVSAGLQPQAYDTITETTVANTGHFARPGPGQQFGDTGRGYFLRLPNGRLSTLRWGNITTQGVNGTPGEGHRVNVVRYDTPAFAGFTASASWGEDDVRDTALRYAGEISGFKLAAGVGYAHWTDGTGADPRGCARLAGAPDISCSEVGLSGSIMHLGTGLFATGAYGYRKDDNVRALYGNAAGVEETQNFYFVQAGIEQKWLALGKTTIFGEYWNEAAGPGLTTNGLRLNAAPLGAGARISNADISLWGVGLNQTLAEGVDMYISYRHAQADVFTSANGSKIGSTKTAIEPFQYVTVGTQIKF
jgi:predicted porin